MTALDLNKCLKQIRGPRSLLFLSYNLIYVPRCEGVSISNVYLCFITQLSQGLDLKILHCINHIYMPGYRTVRPWCRPSGGTPPPPNSSKQYKPGLRIRVELVRIQPSIKSPDLAVKKKPGRIRPSTKDPDPI